MAELVSKASIAAAADTVRGIVTRTPLLRAPWAEHLVGGEVRLKCENLQRAGSFKIRGAYTLISRLPAEMRERGVITYSSGNHGQGVALAAQLFGVKAVVVMPTTAPVVKIEGAKSYGADVILEGTTSNDRKKRAEAEQAAHGYAMVPPFDHPDIIAGQGTIGVEILEDWPDVEAVLVPIGGGGMASGVAAWVKRTQPSCRVIGVEPAVSDAMRQSRQAGHPVSIEFRSSIADGLLPVRPGDLTFQHVYDLADDVVTVTEDDILDATKMCLQKGKLIVEFSGAATLAALLSGKAKSPRAVAVLSGGNLDAAKVLGLMTDAATPAVSAA